MTKTLFSVAKLPTSMNKKCFTALKHFDIKHEREDYS